MNVSELPLLLFIEDGCITDNCRQTYSLRKYARARAHTQMHTHMHIRTYTWTIPIIHTLYQSCIFFFFFVIWLFTKWSFAKSADWKKSSRLCARCSKLECLRCVRYFYITVGVNSVSVVMILLIQRSSPVT